MSSELVFPSSANSRALVSRLTGGDSFLFRRNKPATPIDEAKRKYGQALNDLKVSLGGYDLKLLQEFEDTCKSRSPPGPDDVVRTITSITDRVAQSHTGQDRRHATRISIFFDRLIKLAPVGDVVIGGAQNLAASGAWGAIRLALEVSVSYMTFFEKVSEMLLQIGKFTQINHELSVLFPKSLSLKADALEYLAVVLRFATGIFDYAKKSRGMQVVSFLLQDFNTSFGPLEKELRTLADSIKWTVSVEATKMNRLGHSNTQKTMSQAISMFRGETKNAKLEACKREIARDLKGKSFGLRWTDYFGRGRSTWLLARDDYRLWKHSSTSRVLWICGKPGSGKSVALASVYSDVLKSSEQSEHLRTPHTTCSFFSRDREAQSALASTVLESITAQIISSVAISSNLDFFMEKNGETAARKLTRTSCVDLLLAFTPVDWTCYIILDGLDQLSTEESNSLFKELSRLSISRRIIMCCSSHPYWEGLGRARSYLGGSPNFETISMDKVDRSSEAVDFIEAETARWDVRGTRFPSAESKTMITSILRKYWKNMFLWLRLQMELVEEDLRDGYNTDDIIGRIHPGLSALYERRLSEVDERNRGISRVILKLATGADPALKFKELRLAANIEPCNSKWSPVSLPKNAAMVCRQYGGNLLEVDDVSDEVRLIHGSVALHLCESHFTYQEAKDCVGLACLTYLGLDALEQALSKRSQKMEKADTRSSQGMAAVVQNALDVSGLDQTLLRPFLRDKHDLLESSLDSSAFIGSMVSRSSADYVLTDFLDYAEANWIAATRSLTLTDAQSSLWHKLVWGSNIHKRLGEQLKDPFQGLSWAISEGHRPLLSRYVADSATLDVSLGLTSPLMTQFCNLLVEWEDYSHGGPVLFTLAWWMSSYRSELFEKHWTRLLRLAHRCSPMPGTATTVNPDSIFWFLDKLNGLCINNLVKSVIEFNEFCLLLHLLNVEPTYTDSNGFSPIVLAIRNRYGAAPRVRALIDSGYRADCRMWPATDKNPLLLAIDLGNTAVAEVILSRTDHVNVISDYRGYFASLELAINKGNLAIVKCLIHNKSKGKGPVTSFIVNVEGGNTALHLAARAGAVNILGWLLKDIYSPSELESRNHQSETALFEALRGGSPGCAELLVMNGARRLLNYPECAWDVTTHDERVREEDMKCLIEECSKMKSYSTAGQESRPSSADEPLLAMEKQGAIVRSHYEEDPYAYYTDGSSHSSLQVCNI